MALPPAGKKRPPRRRADGDVLVWGINPVRELLVRQPRLILEVTVLAGGNPRLSEIRGLAEQAGIPVLAGKKENFPRENHQGVVARLRPPSHVRLESLLARLGDGEPLCLLALDCVQDPHNLGAVLRSAAAAGVDAVLLPKDRTAPLSGTVYKVSAGAVAVVDICRVTNLTGALQRLKKAGAWVFGADGRATTSIYQADLSLPLCLVMGGEGRGIRPLVRKQCDVLVSIPMQNALESLNVAVSTAVILFEIVRRRL